TQLNQQVLDFAASRKHIIRVNTISAATIFADIPTSMDNVGVSEIRSSGGCMPHVVTMDQAKKSNNTFSSLTFLDPTLAQALTVPNKRLPPYRWNMATTSKLDPNYGDKGKMIITGLEITNVADSNKIE
nr:hypothetical protein [Tanacetum cinerariifolium]